MPTTNARLLSCAFCTTNKPAIGKGVQAYAVPVRLTVGPRQLVPIMMPVPEQRQFWRLMKGTFAETGVLAHTAPVIPTPRHADPVVEHAVLPQPLAALAVHAQPVPTVWQKVAAAVVKPPGSALHVLHADANGTGETVEPAEQLVSTDEPRGHLLPFAHGVSR